VSPSAELRELLPRAAELVAGLSDAEFNWRPAPGAWSVAECLAHLNVIDEQYACKIRDAIAKAREAKLTSPGPFRLGLIEGWFVRFQEPPYKMRFKAPKRFKPQPAHHIQKVLEDWRRTRVELLQLVSEAEGLDWKRVRVISPASNLISLSLLGAFAVVAAHDRRHLWQAGRIRAMLPKKSAAFR
jgi:hypothetical protein